MKAVVTENVPSFVFYRRHLHREHEENQALAQPANVLHQPANVFNADEDDDQEQVEGVQAEELDND